MLTACLGGARPAIDRPGSAPDPVIEQVVVRQPYCPGDLFRDTGEEPRPGAGAVVEHNEAGAEFIDGVIGYAQQLLSIITASRQACADMGAVPQ
jgi:hypothetical protein